MKYLITGLGNIGDEYSYTRHNIGFMVLDAWAASTGTGFNDKRYGSVAEIRHRGRIYILLKPSTYMNLSGNAVNYWLKKEKIPVENLLVITDDIALPAGSIRIRPGGGDGGHNGLSHISAILGHNSYARIRFGIGNDFPPGGQVHYVLEKWSSEEINFLKPRIELTVNMIKSFGFAGLELTMTRYNREGKSIPGKDE
ncbi:MAG: aminoacyl-tRNA hydrolase [Bacteroidales bacterium]|nr:aminoacyl-tRNA hydrolase [Bacteroidales bacterium]